MEFISWKAMIGIEDFKESVLAVIFLEKCQIFVLNPWRKGKQSSLSGMFSFILSHVMLISIYFVSMIITRTNAFNIIVCDDLFIKHQGFVFNLISNF